MSIRQSLLALVAEQPRYGYQLRSEFERRTGGTWPLNIGQVYTTLQRLERDGMVTSHQADDAGAVVYEITTKGRLEVDAWWGSPVPRAAPARDETTIKFAMAVTMGGVDVGALVQAQRRETIQALQHLTRLKRTGGGDVPALILDRLIFDTEAEARWLDHIEASITAARRTNGTGAASKPLPQAGSTAGPAGAPHSQDHPSESSGDRSIRPEGASR